MRPSNPIETIYSISFLHEFTLYILNLKPVVFYIWFYMFLILICIITTVFGFYLIFRYRRKKHTLQSLKNELFDKL